MRIYYYGSATGIFMGSGEAEPDPMEDGKYLIPANATLIEPPEIPNGKRAVYRGGAWELEDIPLPPSTPEPTLDELKAAKVAEFTARASVELGATDYKVLRQLGQKTCGIPTSMTFEEYQALEVSRQAVRDKCNDLQARAQHAADATALALIVWEGAS